MPEIRTIHHVTHESGGGDEVDLTGLTGAINYVDRGDAQSYDFAGGSFTKDGAWHEISLASIVPAGAKAVFVAMEAYDNQVGLYYRLRAKGYTGTYNIVQLAIQVANQPIYQQGFIPVGSDRVIEYYFSGETWDFILLNIRGWLI
jgi:hypothetical protein